MNPYDDEPVLYCKHCLSLRIKTLDLDIDYCDCCNSTDLGTTSIAEWEDLYYQKYHKKP